MKCPEIHRTEEASYDNGTSSCLCSPHISEKYSYKRDHPWLIALTSPSYFLSGKVEEKWKKGGEVWRANARDWVPSFRAAARGQYNRSQGELHELTR